MADVGIGHYGAIAGSIIFTISTKKSEKIEMCNELSLNFRVNVGIIHRLS